MRSWERWWQRPQRSRLRQIVFQVHRWLGLVLSAYVVMLSLTGSVLVYRRELTRLLDVKAPAYDATATPLSAEQLRAAALRVFPDHRVLEVDASITRRSPIAEVWIERGGERRERAFNPYTGADLGDAYPSGLKAIVWVANLHDDLLLGRTNRWVNGVGSILVTMLTLSGIVVWWPGVTSWRRAVAVQWRTRWRRFNWDLHRASGFWLFPLMLNWSITGIYLALPVAFLKAIDYLSPADGAPGMRAGDVLLDWLTRIHFGRWPNPFFKALWFAIGLAPALLAVTGVMMWWSRARRRSVKEHTPAPAFEPPGVAAATGSVTQT